MEKLVKDVCREYGISDATYYNWKVKYGGMESSDIKRLKDLEEENRRLKHMYAELSLDHKILKDIVEKKLSNVIQLTALASCLRYYDAGGIPGIINVHTDFIAS